MCFLTLAVLVASPIFAQAQATDTPPAAQDLRQTALGFRNAQDFDKAIETYKALLAQNPPDAFFVKVDLGLCYKGAGDYSKAIALFTEIAQQSADARRVALMDADDCLLEQGKIAESIDFMTKVCSDYPEVADAALLRRAQRRYDICKYAEALADFQKCLADYKYDSDQTAVIKTRIDELRLHTAKLFDGSPEAIQAELTRAQAANEEGSYVKLLKLRLGENLLREQKWTEAKSHLEALLSEYPSDAVNIKMSLGFCHRGMKNYDEAIALYREIAAGNSPRKLDAIFCIRYAMIEQGKTDEAASYFAALETTYPEVASQVIFKRAVLRAEETGETKASIDDFKRFVADNPNDRQTPWAKLQIASQSLFFERKPDAIRAMLQDFFAAYPEYSGMIEARSILADCSCIDGNFARARELYSAAYEYPDFGTYKPFLLYMIGDCYDKIGDTDNAIATWNKLMELYPEDLWVAVAKTQVERMQSQKEGK